MSKFTFYFKSLLVACGLLLGSANAWAESLNATVKMTYVNYSDPDHSYGEIAAGSTSNSGYNKLTGTYPSQTVGFANTGWRVNYITYLQVDASALPSGATITGATLSFKQSGSTDSKRTTGVGAGYNSSTWSSTMTYNTADKSITTVGSVVWTSTKSSGTFEDKEINIKDAFTGDADKIVTILLYETAAAGCYIKNPAVTITYSMETVYTASFTANSGSITPTINIYSDAEHTSPVTNGTLTDKTTYYYRAVLAGYNNYEGSFTVDGANPSVSFTMTAKTRYTFTVNAVDAGSNIIKTIYTDADSYEGKTHNIVYPKYLTGTGNIVTYSKNDDTYGESKTAQGKNETFTVSYTAYTGVAYFVEVEDVVSATAYGSWNCSNGGAVRGLTTAKEIFTVPTTGVYNITYAACNNNVNYDLAVTLSKNETEIATKSDLKSVSINFIKSTGIITNNNVSLAKDDVLKLTPSTSNGIIDYMLIELIVNTSISEAGYATFNSDFALDLDNISGATAYIVKADAASGDNIVITPQTGKVAANTGLILKGAAGPVTIPVAASGTDISATNKLVAVTEDATAVAAGNYVLGATTENSHVGLYKLETTLNLNKGQAYLPSGFSSVKVLNFIVEGETPTGVETVQGEGFMVNDEYYNLNGQRVTADYKGIVIKNGKKYLNK